MELLTTGNCPYRDFTIVAASDQEAARCVKTQGLYPVIAVELKYAASKTDVPCPASTPLSWEQVKPMRQLRPLMQPAILRQNLSTYTMAKGDAGGLNEVVAGWQAMCVHAFRFDGHHWLTAQPFAAHGLLCNHAFRCLW